MLLNFYRTLSVALAITYGAQAISLENASTNVYMMTEEESALAQTYEPTEAAAALTILTEAVASANKINVKAASDMAKAKAIVEAKKQGINLGVPQASPEDAKKAEEKKKCTTKKCQQKAKEQVAKAKAAAQKEKAK